MADDPDSARAREAREILEEHLRGGRVDEPRGGGNHLHWTDGNRPPGYQADLERRQKRVAAWLHEKWGDRPCPFCDALEWSFDPEPVVLPRRESIRPAAGPLVYMVRCENCGAGVPVSAETSGAWPGEFDQ
jgi:hypothetical protein